MRILFSLLLIAGSAHALQDGDVDTSFGANGFRYLDTVPVGGVPTNERGQYAARLSDGRLLVALQGQQSGAQRAITAVFSADGNTLLASQEFALDFSNGVIDPPTRGFGMDDAGALYIGGTSSTSGVAQAYVLKVLPPDYVALDETWGNAGVATLAPLTTTSFLNAMHVEADGDVVICGDGRLPDGPLIGFCSRLLNNGTLDENFGEGFFVINEADVRLNLIQSVAPTSDGGYLIAGQATLTDGLRYNLIAQLTPFGTLDPTFCAACTGANIVLSAPGFRVDPGEVLFSCPRIALRPDGEIAHVSIDYRSGGSMLAYRRYSANGALTGGLSETYPGVFAHQGCDNLLSVQPDNKVVFAYSLRLDGIQYGALIRYPATPSLAEPRDPTFSAAAEFIRAPLPGAVLGGSNECNYALVEADGILCVGLTRVSDGPTNIDLMLARVVNGVPDELLADGFETPP